MNKDKDLIDAGDMKPKRPVNLAGRLVVLRVMLNRLGRQSTRMGGQMALPVSAMVHEP